MGVLAPCDSDFRRARAPDRALRLQNPLERNRFALNRDLALRICSVARTGVTMPHTSLSDFVYAMEAAGMLVRVTEEKRVDELPRVMEDHPTTAVLVEKVTGCEFSFLANAYSNQDQDACAMG